MLTRRQFIKVGIGSAVVLAAAKILHDRWPREPRPAAAPPAPDREARAVVAALVPVVLAGALAPEQPQSTLSRVTDGVLGAIAGLPPAAQAEIDELFALLSFAPTRFLIAGVHNDWRRASAAQIRRFLDRWRGSRFELPQAGYHALNQLILAAWYTDPQAWPATGYPGPPQIAQ